MKFFRAFIAGLVVPAVVLPFGLAVLSVMGKEKILTTPILHFIPLIWGLWNVVYFLLIRWVLYLVDVDFRLYITGGLLGFLVALIAIFGVHLPEELGLSSAIKYTPLVVLPIAYAILWRYLVKPLNELLDLNN